MNSRARLVDHGSGAEKELTRMFPEDADIAQGTCSGYRVGDVFEWVVPAGRRRIKVKEILYHPEAAGDYYL